MATIEVKAKPGEKVWIVVVDQHPKHIIRQEVLLEVQATIGSTWYIVALREWSVSRTEDEIFLAAADAQAECDRRSKEGKG